MRRDTPFCLTLKRSHQQTNGQALIFVVLVLFSLVCLFALTINVGNRITGKIEMQNAADASAMTAAVWNARGLNTISVLNVSMTECLALIIMFKAFNDTLEYANIAVEINIPIATALSNLPYVGPIFAAWKACLEITKQALDSLFDGINEIMQQAIDPLWDIMKGLRYAEIGISYAAPAMALIDASRVARLNGADPVTDAISESLTDLMPDILEPYALLLPVFDRLPVNDDAAFTDLCPPTRHGGPGYDHFLCWDSALEMEVGPLEVRHALGLLWATTSCIVPPPAAAWYIFLELHYRALCTGQSQSQAMDTNTTDCDVCEDNNGVQTWQGERARVSQQDYNCRGSNINAISGEDLGERSSGSGDIIAQDPCKRCRRYRGPPISCDCNSDPDCTNCDSDGRGTKRDYFLETWVLTDCVYQEDYTVDADSTSDKPAPLMLADDWQERMSHTAITIKIVGDWLSLHRYEEGGQELTGPEKTTWGIARAKIYNPSGADLFNQDWRVKMAPCDLENLNLAGGISLPSSVSKFADKGLKEILIH